MNHKKSQPIELEADAVIKGDSIRSGKRVYRIADAMPLIECAFLDADGERNGHA